MKTTSHTDEPISKEDWIRIRRLLDFDETNFVQQAKICELDPATDFQNSDLANVDFSNCDLRGFNFSGADLRGSFGINMTWETGDPVLDGADTSDSLFTHELQQQLYFREHPDDMSLVRRLSTDYWANTIAVVDDLLQSKNDPIRSARISHAVFAAHKDNSVRTNILYLMRSKSASDHKHFIYDLLSKNWDNPAQAISCLHILIAFYGDSGQPFNWLLKYLKHPDDKVQQIAFFGLLKSPKFKSALEEIKNYAINCHDRVRRRAFVGRAAKLLGPDTEAALYNYKEGNYLDFRTTLDRQLLIETWNQRNFARLLEDSRPSDGHKIEAIREEFLLRRIRSIQDFGKKIGIYYKYSIDPDRTVELGSSNDLDVTAPERTR